MGLPKMKMDPVMEIVCAHGALTLMLRRVAFLFLGKVVVNNTTSLPLDLSA